MRILHCSDFHDHEPWYRWLIQEGPRYDLVCLTGDFLEMSARSGLSPQIQQITAHLRALDVPLALCSGNHDLDGAQGAGWLKALRRERFWSDGDTFTLCAHRFRCVGWGQTLPPARADEIWLIHQPPNECATSLSRSGTDHGDFDLGELCRSGHGPQIALSGHIHDAAGWKARVGKTWSFNPSQGQSSSQPNAVIIDLGRNFAFRVNHDHEGRGLSEPLRLG